ncbi:MAG: hypothetical protein KDJ52_29580, partial [Anaerolineae bacterium]|nr:hypothetical protein [Anaerolineae bacterium]
MRANLRTGRRYQPQPYPGRVTLFKTTVSLSSTTWGWGDIARGGIELHAIPGHHMNVLRSPQIARIDTTTASSYGEVTAEGLLQFGYSKDHRPELGQVKIASV